MPNHRASPNQTLQAFYLARTASDIPSDLSIPSIFIAIICERTYPVGFGPPAWFIR